MRDVELPWLRSTSDPSGPAIAIVTGMTGEEEDMFLDKKKMSDGRALNHVMLNCVGSINDVQPQYEDMAGLTTVDRLALLLGIRYETYGPDIVSTMRCMDAACRQSFPVDLSLDAVTMHPTPRSAFEGPTGEYDIALSDGAIARYRLLTGHGEQVLARTPEEEQMTIALMVPLVRVTRADGSLLPDNDKKKWLKKLGLRQRQELRDGIEAKAFGYDTRFKAPCPYCDTENSGVLEGLNGFFFLQKSSQTTAKPS